MEFVDYKCLESLLIEGEELIVTEGFKDTAFKIIKGIFIFISRVIEKIIVNIKNSVELPSSILFSTLFNKVFFVSISIVSLICVKCSRN